MADVKGAEIVPAILATSIEQYNQLVERLGRFARRISIDLSDGLFTPSRTINLIEAHWSGGIMADIHLMFARPLTQLETLISRQPHLVVIHAEAQGNLASMLGQLQAVGIKAGIALLPATSPGSVRDLIKAADQVLIFAGKLGEYGGQFDRSQLAKIEQVRSLEPEVEIAWDGGINADNAAAVIAAGAAVLNVGGFIAKAENPRAAYQQLVAVAQGGRVDN